MDLTVERARQGDASAFEELYRAHADAVYTLASRLASDEHEAADMTQDVFIRLWQKLRLYKEDIGFSTWLRRLAVNVCYNHLSANKRRGLRVFAAKDPAIFETDRPHPQYDANIDMERAIARLPVKARRILVLHEVEGYKQREIADMTGVAEGTVKAQLHRARKLLQEALDE